MTKFEITKKGKSCENFTWDRNKRIFSTNETGLIINFVYEENVTFITGDECVFYTGRNCNFITKYKCIFHTAQSCNFITNAYCNFNTEDNCNFNTEDNCNFNTEDNCNFNTEDNCNFNTEDNCNFNTSYKCTFNTGKECAVIRKDVFEVILLKENQIIKLNDFKTIGYEVIQPKHLIIINNKEIELSEDSYLNLKKQLV